MRKHILVVATTVTLTLACATARNNPPSDAPTGKTVDIATPRSEAKLQALLAKYDAATPAVRMQLEQQVDQAAGQRYAAVARLFWHTDMAAAQAESRASGQPILSLRMLGRLDEELSCTNSRFFRVVLYPDPTVNAYLREHFVLHWSTERPVPVMTIEMGDGRKIVRTTTGNSAHYVLDAQGRPIDVLPGLYAPREFVAGLQQAVAMELKVRGLADSERWYAIRDFHKSAYDMQLARWQKITNVIAPVAKGGLAGATDMENVLKQAQLASVSKGYVEVPDLQQIKLGPDPLEVKEHQEFWRLAGQGLFGYGLSFVDEVLPEKAMLVGMLGLSHEHYNKKIDDVKRQGQHLLSAESKKLFLQMFNLQPGNLHLSVDLDAVRLSDFEGLLVADTAQNEFVLHQKIHQLFVESFEKSVDFNKLNDLIYSVVFFTPQADSWMGLVNEASFVALPKAGIVNSAPNIH